MCNLQETLPIVVTCILILFTIEPQSICVSGVIATCTINFIRTGDQSLLEIHQKRHVLSCFAQIVTDIFAEHLISGL